MYVGRLSPRKGVDIVVNAVQRLRSQGIDASLDIVGAVFPGYEWYEAELRSLVDRNGTSDQVRFHGFQHEVWQFFDAADVVVVPSRVDEPFGNTAVEAALAARPAVVSQTSGLKEAAAGYSSVQFVEPDDLDAVVDALQRVVDARSDFFESAMADREIALDRHGLDRYRRSISSAVQAMNQSAR
jgi:glycosyltransferase involved in cell wall biosynthesis